MKFCYELMSILFKLILNQIKFVWGNRNDANFSEKKNPLCHKGNMKKMKAFFQEVVCVVSSDGISAKQHFCVTIPCSLHAHGGRAIMSIGL